MVTQIEASSIPYFEELKRLGFDEIHDVRGRPSIALLLRELKLTRRSGVYLLQFSDDTFYIGLARDVVRRFSQHRHSHGDRIIGFSFQAVPIRELAERERILIQQGERLGVPLDQTEWKTTPYGDSDLDDLIAPSDAEKWLRDPNWPFPNDKRVYIPYDPGRCLRDTRLFKSFMERSDFRDLLQLLRTYVLTTVPAPRTTEHDFWDVSCLPMTNRSSWPRLFCVSVHLMEILVVGHKLDDKKSLWGFVNCAKSVISKTYLGQDDLGRRFGSAEYDFRGYKSAGDDEIMIRFGDLETAYALVSDTSVRNACALLNYRVMRKGVTRYANFHCSALADAILADESSAS